MSPFFMLCSVIVYLCLKGESDAALNVKKQIPVGEIICSG